MKPVPCSGRFQRAKHKPHTWVPPGLSWERKGERTQAKEPNLIGRRCPQSAFADELNQGIIKLKDQEEQQKAKASPATNPLQANQQDYLRLGRSFLSPHGLHGCTVARCRPGRKQHIRRVTRVARVTWARGAGSRAPEGAGEAVGGQERSAPPGAGEVFRFGSWTSRLTEGTQQKARGGDGWRQHQKGEIPVLCVSLDVFLGVCSAN